MGVGAGQGTKFVRRDRDRDRVSVYVHAGCTQRPNDTFSTQVMTLHYWTRYLDRKKEGDIMRNIVARKVYALREQARGMAIYDFPVL